MSERSGADDNIAIDGSINSSIDLTKVNVHNSDHEAEVDDAEFIYSVDKLTVIDVLGVDSNTNGRMCNQHETCGHHVRVNDVLYCSWELQKVDRSGASLPFNMPDHCTTSGVAATLPASKRKPVTRKKQDIKRKKRHNNERHASDILFDDSEDDEDGMEEVVKIYKVERDGMANCHVGYLPRRLFKKHGAKSFDALFLRVDIDLRVSPNSSERARSHRNYGMITCGIIRNNPRYNGRKPLDGVPCDCSLSDSDVESGISDLSETNRQTSDKTNANKAERVKFSRRNNEFR